MIGKAEILQSNAGGVSGAGESSKEKRDSKEGGYHSCVRADDPGQSIPEVRWFRRARPMINHNGHGHFIHRLRDKINAASTSRPMRTCGIRTMFLRPSPY